MPTDDERREVAARLRDIGEKICYTSRDVLRAIQDACGCNVGLDWEDMEELRDRLADLIEPDPERTCKLDKSFKEPGFMENVMEYECSECGGLTNAQIFHESDEPRYCAMCGAKVVE